MADFQEPKKAGDDPAAKEREGQAAAGGTPVETNAKKQGGSRGRWVLLGLLVLVGVVLVVTLVDREQTLERNLGDNLCPPDTTGIKASAALVVDLAKPLHDTSFVSGLVGTVTRDLGMDEELRVYAITVPDGVASAPTLVGRICKPYNNADLLFGPAKDQSGAWRDCDDLPAQLPPTLRELAGSFCAARDQLQSAIDTLTIEAEQRQFGANVAATDMVATLRDMSGALSTRPAPRKLFIFSDMLQHAARYSHFDLDWTRWAAAEYVGESSDSVTSDLSVSIFYLPRQRLTDPLRLRNAHQQFWRSFFQGAQVRFQDLPAKPAYAVERLMPVESDEEEDEVREETDRLLAETELLQEVTGKVAEARDRLADLRQQPAAQTTDADDESSAADAANAGDSGTAETPPPEPQTAVDSPPPAAVVPIQTPAVATPSEAEVDSPDDGPPEIPATNESPNSAELAVEDDAEPVPALAERNEDAAPAASEPAPATPEPPPATPPPPAAELAVADVPSPAAGTCEVTVQPRFLAQPYPDDRRVNYGDATVVVDFLLDESGATVDAEVLWRSEESSSTRPRNLDALAADTLADVRDWEVDFSSTSACAEPQRRRATFTYRSKCVGAPSPSCRTVREEVDILALEETP